MRYIIAKDRTGVPFNMFDDEDAYHVIIIDTVDGEVCARYYTDAEDGTRLERATKFADHLNRTEA